MSLLDLLQWWNLLFDLPFVAALIPLLLQATGAAHLGHAGHGAHVGNVGLHGHHVHVPHFGHHHVEAGTHVVPAAHAGHGAVHQVHQDHAHAEHHVESPGLLSRALGLLGIGKVPIMMVFSSFSFVWGFTGLVANLFLSKAFPAPALFVWPSVGISLLASLCLTSVLSQGFARLMPSVETYIASREELAGRIGHALYEIDATSGAAVVLDDESNRVQVKCRTEDAQRIPHGAKVVLIRYDEQLKTFFVRQENETLEGGQTPKLLD